MMHTQYTHIHVYKKNFIDHALAQSPPLDTRYLRVGTPDDTMSRNVGNILPARF